VSTIAALVSGEASRGSDLIADLHIVLASGLAEGGSAGRVNTWTNGRVALGHCGSAGDPNGPQPYVDRASGSAIVFDGRIDNLDEVKDALQIGRHDGATPAAIVLAAHLRWGEAAGGRLLGDFAFAIWDAPAGRLVCVRDPLGQRPLFYTVNAGATIVASDAHQVIAHPDVPAVPHEGILAEYLTSFVTTVDETIWRDVYRLPQAHALVVSDGGLRVTRYWDFDLARVLRYRRAEEYDEHFRELFTRAVECRMRGEPKVGIFLSGGIDSSAIAGVAASARSAGGPAVHAVSLVYPGNPCDETRFIDDTIRRWNLPSERLSYVPPVRADFEREVERFRNLPLDPHGGYDQPQYRRAVEKGLRVMLTGFGGDEWFTGSPSHTADLLGEGRVIAATRQLLHDAALPGRAYTYLGLARGAVGSLLPAWIRRVLRPIAGARPLRHDWIPAAFAARVGLPDRQAPRTELRGSSRAQRDVYRMANGIQRTLADEHEQRASRHAGLDERHPFYDRRVAEFGLALPEPERNHQGVTKLIVRRALADLLVDSVRTRNDKAEFSSTCVAAIAALGGRAALARLRSADAGWVDGAVALRMHDDMIRLYREGDAAYIRLADVLWTILAIDLWLEHAVGVPPVPRKERHYVDQTT
jgi:asparagine synthase (glutamine-hydrolysing)